MNAAGGPVVIDTGVFGADLVPGSPLVALYEPFVAGRPAFISFQTVAELRFGALQRNWGAARMRNLETRLRAAQIVYPGPDLVQLYAQLRVDCARIGHALGQRAHDADRWVAATAIRLDVPLVAHDRVFKDVPGLDLFTMT